MSIPVKQVSLDGRRQPGLVQGLYLSVQVSPQHGVWISVVTLAIRV